MLSVFCSRRTQRHRITVDVTPSYFCKLSTDVGINHQAIFPQEFEGRGPDGSRVVAYRYPIDFRMRIAVATRYGAKNGATSRPTCNVVAAL